MCDRSGLTRLIGTSRPTTGGITQLDTIRHAVSIGVESGQFWSPENFLTIGCDELLYVETEGVVSDVMRACVAEITTDIHGARIRYHVESEAARIDCRSAGDEAQRNDIRSDG